MSKWKCPWNILPLSQNDLVELCNVENWSNLAFDYYLGPSKQLQTIVHPPSIQSSIERQMKLLKGPINTLHSYFLHFFECCPIEGDEVWGGGTKVHT